MQSTTDPATLRKLAKKQPPPNVLLAAAGLGLHRGAYREASRAMADLNSAYPHSIPAAIQKNAGIIALVKVRIRVTVTVRVTLTLTLTLT